VPAPRLDRDTHAAQHKTSRTPDEINTIVTALGSVLDVLRDADPADKAKIYNGVGLRPTHQPGQTK
jgi:site-specific DNA recombinase